jgi:hypothetical protein
MVDYLTIRERGLLAILNEGLLHGQDSFAVNYPVLNVQLLWSDMRAEKVEVRASGRDFALPEGVEMASKLREDLPNHNDLVSCLLTSGVMDFRNADQINDGLSGITERSRNWKSTPKRQFLGMDTNMMYFKFPSRRLPREASMCHVYSAGVEKELATMMNDKYKGGYIEQMSRVLKPNVRLGFLQNMPMKDSRRAVWAKQEIEYLRAIDGLKADCEDVVPGKNEENDLKIVSSYERFARGQNAEVTVMSGDRDFLTKAHSSSMGIIEVQLPAEAPARADADMVRMMHLVNDLANVFGVVDLSGLGTRVYGVWPGKTFGECLDGILQVEIDKNLRYHDEMAKTLAVLSKIY